MVSCQGLLPPEMFLRHPTDSQTGLAHCFHCCADIHTCTQPATKARHYPHYTPEAVTSHSSMGILNVSLPSLSKFPPPKALLPPKQDPSITHYIQNIPSPATTAPTIIPQPPPIPLPTPAPPVTTAVTYPLLVSSITTATNPGCSPQYPLVTVSPPPYPPWPPPPCPLVGPGVGSPQPGVVVVIAGGNVAVHPSGTTVVVVVVVSVSVSVSVTTSSTLEIIVIVRTPGGRLV